MKPRKEFRALLTRKKLKKTSQREFIWQILMDSKGHPSVEEIRDRLLAKGHRIGIATIYRTLKILLAAGMNQIVEDYLHPDPFHLSRAERHLRRLPWSLGFVAAQALVYGALLTLAGCGWRKQHLTQGYGLSYDSAFAAQRDRRADGELRAGVGGQHEDKERGGGEE